MADPPVLGTFDCENVEVPLSVRVHRGAVEIGCGAVWWRLTGEQADELAGLLITAFWQAERDAAAMAEVHGG